MDGDEDRAARLLETCSGEHAANLLAFIRKRRIQILSQLPWSQTGEGPHLILAGGRTDPKFLIHNIGFEGNDLPNGVSANIHQFYNPESPPDLYLAQMVEWHFIPPNLQELGCPLIGQTVNYDRHIHAVYPWLQLFDHLIVTDSTTHHEASRLSAAPTYTFPKSYCLPQTLPPYRHDRDIADKDLDLLITGNAYHPYNRDKGALIRNILEIEDLQLLLANGFLYSTQYAHRLSRSRLALSYFRRPGVTSTRGLEALAMGVPLLSQPESTLGLWVGEDEGLLTYTPDTLKNTIQDALSNYAKHHEAAARGGVIIRTEFDVKRVASQYLRFAVFLASKPRAERRRFPAPTQRSVNAWQGWRQSEAAVYIALRQNAFEAWRTLKPEDHSVETLNAPARETMLTCVRMGLAPASQNLRDLLPITLELYRAGLQTKPNSLTLRFNFVRAALHFGTEPDIEQGLSLATETLDATAGNFTLDLLDDVMTWDYCNEFFNYRAYFDIVTYSIANSIDRTAELKNLIFASLHYYRARMAGAIEDFAFAAKLDPNFPNYRLWWAKALDATGDRQSALDAVPLLENLATNSLQVIDASSLLQSIESDHDLPSPRRPGVTVAVERLKNQTFSDADYAAIRYSAYFQAQRLDLARNNGVKVLKEPSVPTPTISILFADLNGGCSRKLNAALERQDIPRDAFEIISAEVFERASPHVMSVADTILLCGQTDFLYNKNVAFNATLMNARGEIVLIIDDDIALPPGALSDIIQFFRANDRPTIAVTNTGANPGAPESLYGLALRREQAVAFGGLDEGPYYTGRAGGPAELAQRLQSKGFEISTLPCLPQHSNTRLVSQAKRASILQELSPFEHSGKYQLPIHENPEIRQMRIAQIDRLL